MNKKNTDKKNFDGVQSVVEMLNLLDLGSRDRLLSHVAERDPQVAEKIRQQMFVFEDLVKFEGRSLQVLLSEVPRHQLVLALRNASKELKDVFFKAMSSRGASLLQEEIDQQGPQKLSLVTAAQRELVEIAKKLVAEGKLISKK